ncbi:MAG: hypothetical protein WC005_00865 [Candidatus Nanopelagicales bacterium]
MSDEYVPESVANQAELEVLANEQFNDDVDLHQLIEKQQRGSLPRGTKVLVGAIAVVIAFFAGSLVQQHFGQTSTGQPGFPGGANFAALRAQGGGFPGAGLTGANPSASGSGQATAELASAGVTVGSVTLVDGNHVYVTSSTGAVTKVNLTDSTSITVSSKATAKQLKTGQQVVVRGTTATDGTVTATVITQGSLSNSTSTTANGN